jgi:Undecaprenyl-phosphate glucose phosphotransferase
MARTSCTFGLALPVRMAEAVPLHHASANVISPRHSKPVSPPLCATIAASGDFAILLALGVCLHALTAGTGHAAPSLALSVATTMCTVVAAQRLGLYTIPALRIPFQKLPHLVAAWTAAMGVPLLVASISGTTETARENLLWFVTGGFCLLSFRLAIATCLEAWARQGRLARRVAVYGSGPPCHALIDALEADQGNNARICGIFGEPDSGRRSTIARYRKLGGAKDLVSFVREASIDLVIVAVPISAEERLLQLLDQLSALPVDIRVAANACKLQLRPRTYSWLGNIALIDLVDKPLADWDVLVKGTFDRLIALLALAALAPLMVLIAIAIKLESRGPVLFRQQRVGFNNQLIEILKFRSMHAAQCDKDASRLVTRGDPRVTRLGAFLRKTSLDELPQLINVLRGDLSLVGPRPHALLAKAADQLYQDAVDGYFTRHKVKPGITGWAQVNGWRGETDTQEKIRKRVEYDIYYIENWSLLFDISILLRTPIALLKTNNAF